MQPDQLAKRVSAATSVRCVIVCAYLEEVAPEHAFLIRDTLNGLDTDGWWFVNPGSFIVAFRSSWTAAKRANACKSALRRLSEEVPELARLGIGSAEGPTLTSLAMEGHLETSPLGNVVNEAFGLAMRDEQNR